MSTKGLHSGERTLRFGSEDAFLMAARRAVVSFAYKSVCSANGARAFTAPGHNALIPAKVDAFRLGLGNRVRSTNDYEAPSVGLMSFLLDAYDVRSVFDVGACEGVLSHILATYRARPITVHAFEMNRDAYAQLEMKSVDPGVVPGRIIPHRAGMSDRHEGERAIWFSRTAMFEDEPHPSQYREALHRRLKFALRGQFNRDKLHKETVLLTTIDQMVRTHGAPQMIKIDVDGYEGKVLNGAGAVIKSHRPLILLELHKDELLARTGWTRARVADFVFDAGYRVAHIKNHNRDAAPDFVKVGRGDRVFDVQSTMHFLCY